MIRLFLFLISFLLLHTWPIAVYGQDQPETRDQRDRLEELPNEARTTLRLIKKAAPFRINATAPCSAISNDDCRSKQRGYYREYTVPTPAGVIAAPGASSPVKTVNTITLRTITGHSAKSAKAYPDDSKKPCQRRTIRCLPARRPIRTKSSKRPQVPGLR